MRRRVTVGGAFIPVLGFIIFQFGLLIVVDRPAFLRSYLSEAFPENPTLDVMGLVLMFGGGIIAVSSILNMLKSIQTQHGETLREITSLKSSLSNTLPLLTREVMELRIKRQCKFCGAIMAGDAIYCPVCKRSQV